MSIFVVDIEADGPVPGLYSMIEIGAVQFEDPTNTFYSKIRSRTDQYIQAALDVTGYTREETEAWPWHMRDVMTEFNRWVLESNEEHRPQFFSDNNGFDWQFVNYYFEAAGLKNPFGHSSTNIMNLYKGFKKNIRANGKKHRKTKHTHHPLDDAMGNVEVLQWLQKNGMKL